MFKVEIFDLEMRLYVYRLFYYNIFKISYLLYFADFKAAIVNPTGIEAIIATHLAILLLNCASSSLIKEFTESFFVIKIVPL